MIATFFNFYPRLVRHAIPAVWEKASPEAILAARLRAADAALREILGDAVGGDEVAEAAALAERAARRRDDRRAPPVRRRTRRSPGPTKPHLVAVARDHAAPRVPWRRAHRSTRQAGDLDPCEALITHGGASDARRRLDVLQRSRAWPDEDWEAAKARLTARGLFDGDRLTDGGHRAAPADRDAHRRGGRGRVGRHLARGGRAAPSPRAAVVPRDRRERGLRAALTGGQSEHPGPLAASRAAPGRTHPREVGRRYRRVGALELPGQRDPRALGQRRGRRRPCPAHSSSSSSTGQCTTSPSIIARSVPDDTTTIVLPGVWPGADIVSTPASSCPDPLPRLEPALERAQLLGGAGVRPDEVRPVARVASVGGVREDDLAVPGGPADVVEVEVGEHHVGDLGRARTPSLASSMQELPALHRPALDLAHPGVDQDHPVAAADEEAAERHLEHPVDVEQVAVGGPVLLVGPPVLDPVPPCEVKAAVARTRMTPSMTGSIVISPTRIAGTVGRPPIR